MDFNAEKVKNECVNWIRDFFLKNGQGFLPEPQPIESSLTETETAFLYSFDCDFITQNDENGFSTFSKDNLLNLSVQKVMTENIITIAMPAFHLKADNLYMSLFCQAGVRGEFLMTVVFG